MTATRPISCAQIVADSRRGRLFDQLLMTALDRAFALAEMNDVAVIVGEHLNLDMARPLDIAFEIDAAVLESRLGFGPRRLIGRGQVRRASRATRIPRPPPPAVALISTG